MPRIRAAEASGNWPSLLSLAEEGVAEDPSNDLYHRWRAYALLQLGRLDQAEEASKRALSLAPNEADAYFVLSMVLRLRNRCREAETTIARLRELGGEDGAYHALTCRNALDLKDNDLLAERVNAFLAYAPANSTAHMLHAVLLARTSHPIEAEAAARHALSLDPENWEAHYALAFALFRRNRPEEALDALDTALRIRPGSTHLQRFRKRVASAAKESARMRAIGRALLRHGVGPLWAAVVAVFAMTGAMILIADVHAPDLDERIVAFPGLIALGLCGVALEFSLRHDGADSEEITLDPDY
ncbi:MAG: tetratricopeptide repeat protein [Pseudomonadota bacterium]